MKRIIMSIAKKNQLFRTIIRKSILLKNRLIYKNYCRKNQIQNNLVVFESYLGRNYSCSPKAIYEEMIKDKRFDKFKFVWFFENINDKKNISELKKAKLIPYHSKEYFLYYSKAKYIFSNSRINEAISIRNNQIYTQCWHGTPLKRLGYDLTVEGGNALNSIRDIKYKYRTDCERFSYLISPSKFTTEKLSSCFNTQINNPNVKMIEKGYPRNDFLYNFSEKDQYKIKKHFNIEKDQRKIILYAPTWRDNQHQSGIGYTFNLEINFDYLKHKLEKDYIILFRAHYLVASSFNFKKYKGFIYDASKIDDINDLYIISDILITDYSSVFFDYANLKRPIIFYMYDLEEYKNDIRGFYINLDELPGNIITNEKNLISEIKSISNNFKYNEKYKKFNDKFNYLDDGNAAKRVIDEIIK